MVALACVFGSVARGQESGPPQESTRTLRGLEGVATVELDAFAIPLVRAASLEDAMRVQGYLHARERFAQMDLMRRSVAGELAALAGALGLPQDRQQRVLRLRRVAEAALAALDQEERALVDAYTEGVNAGLASLESPPAEHALLGASPEPWRSEDSLLVGLAMAAMLNDSARIEIEFAAVAETLPRAAIDFLRSPASRWDAPVVADPKVERRPAPDGPPDRTPKRTPEGTPNPKTDQQSEAIDASHHPPPPELLDTRKLREALERERASADADPSPRPGRDSSAERRVFAAETDTPRDERLPIGSNGWVIAGSHTAHGHAILASDMHLPLSVPGIWYRMSIEVVGSEAEVDARDTEDDAERPGRAAQVGAEAAKASQAQAPDSAATNLHRLTLHGLTLPGIPGLIVGSNGDVAWGFTNVEGDFIDFVVIETDPEDTTRYLVPGGSEPFGVVEETLQVGRDRTEALTIRTTRWGPVTGTDGEGRPLAIVWTAMQPNGLNLGHLRLASAKTTAEAIEAAAAMRGPQQNVVIADRHGSIGWTISGYLPDRFGTPDASFDGSVPHSWADGTRGWRGERPESERPRLLNPDSGVIVTANQRTLPIAQAERFGRMWAGPERAFRIWELTHERLPRSSARQSSMSSEPSVGAATQTSPPLSASTSLPTAAETPASTAITSIASGEASLTIDEAACAAMQLDVRSPRLVAWRDAIVASLERTRSTQDDEESTADDADRRSSPTERRSMRDAALRLLASWDGEATVDSKAVAVVSRTREALTATITRAWIETALLSRQPELAAAERANLAARLARGWPDDEAALRLLDARPEHLLPPGAATWDALLEETLLAVIAEIRTTQKNPKEGLPRWGTMNQSSIAHPLARAAPMLASTFSIPAHEQPGHWSTVRVATPRFGASNRLVVAPGREANATLTTPAGQSANPSSRHYKDLHPFWRDGAYAPLLPGPPEARWVLEPTRPLSSE
jgi:penicillin G amidase